MFMALIARMGELKDGLEDMGLARFTTGRFRIIHVTLANAIPQLANAYFFQFA